MIVGCLISLGIGSGQAEPSQAKELLFVSRGWGPRGGGDRRVWLGLRRETTFLIASKYHDWMDHWISGAALRARALLLINESGCLLSFARLVFCLHLVMFI